MEKLEKLFDSRWAVVIFYVLIALVSFLIARGVNNAAVSSTEEVTNTYYAFVD